MVPFGAPFFFNYYVGPNCVIFLYAAQCIRHRINKDEKIPDKLLVD